MLENKKQPTTNAAFFDLKMWSILTTCHHSGMVAQVPLATAQYRGTRAKTIGYIHQDFRSTSRTKERLVEIFGNHLVETMPKLFRTMVRTAPDFEESISTTSKECSLDFMGGIGFRVRPYRLDMHG